MPSTLYSLAITASLLTAIANALVAPRPHGPKIQRSASVQSVTPEFPCYNFADPDNGIADYCMCYNGASTSVAATTGTNTGSDYNPCPYTEAPPAPTTTPIPRARFAVFDKRANTTTSAGNATVTSTTQLPCYNFADPDNGVGDFCMCSNGVSTPVAAATGTNTGTNYNPCPYTVEPTVQVTSISTPSSPPKPTTVTCTDDLKAAVRAREPLATMTQW